MNYRERENQWVNDNNIKAGSKVIVTRIATSYEDGWENNWPSDMNRFIGQICTVVLIDRYNVSTGIILTLVNVDGSMTYRFPYFVLKAVDTPPLKPQPMHIPLVTED